MPSPATFLVFSGAALLLLLIPGPAVLYIVTRSTTQGRGAGLVSVAGIHVGTLVHIAAAVAGLSAVIVASASTFTVIKLAGAAYLVFLGVATLRHRDEGGNPEVTARTHRRIFTDAVVLNILNPKTAVFFLAFVPQFIDIDRGHTTTQLIALGVTFIVLGTITDSAYALTAAWLRHRLGGGGTAGRRGRTAAGITYVGLGVATAMSGRTN